MLESRMRSVAGCAADGAGAAARDGAGKGWVWGDAAAQAYVAALALACEVTWGRMHGARIRPSSTGGDGRYSGRKAWERAE